MWTSLFFEVSRLSLVVSLIGVFACGRMAAHASRRMDLFIVCVCLWCALRVAPVDDCSAAWIMIWSEHNHGFVLLATPPKVVVALAQAPGCRCLRSAMSDEWGLFVVVVEEASHCRLGTWRRSGLPRMELGNIVGVFLELLHLAASASHKFRAHTHHYGWFERPSQYA